MGRITRAAPHLPLESVKARMLSAPNQTQRRRWNIVYNALVEPRLASSIALHCGVSVPTVRVVISTYNRIGPTALDTPGKGGRRNQYLSLAQEDAFLAPFFDRAAKGQIATADEIQRALEGQLAHPVHPSTVYRLLERHQWSKRVPRPTHPQANPEQQSEFKKTSPARSQR
jgi:transposase